VLSHDPVTDKPVLPSEPWDEPVEEPLTELFNEPW
jgi:hypothetical protein